MQLLTIGRLIVATLLLSACQGHSTAGDQTGAPIEFRIEHPAGLASTGAQALPSACDYASDGQVFRTAHDTVRYCGRLTDEGLTRLKAALTPGDSRLEIASAGGSLDAPIDFAFLVRRNELAIDVIGPCFSGCASFVFVASSERRIGPYGIIGMHNTASSAAVMAATFNEGELNDNALPLFRRSQREHQLYQLAGVGIGLLYEPQNRVKTVCAEIVRLDVRTRESVVDIASEFDLWLPDKQQLNAYGINFSGDLPRNLKDAVGRFQIVVGDQSSIPKFTMALGDIQKTPDILLRETIPCLGELSVETGMRR